MMKHAMHQWLGPDGKPDVHKMVDFIEHQDRSRIIGTGILLLGLQAMRALFHTRVDAFWIIVAVAFVIGGFWELWEVAIPLAPFILIAVGLGLIVWYCTKTLNRRKRIF
jgi:Flp pilus assembly protein TadB